MQCNACSEGAAVTTLTVRNVDPELRERLRVRAALNGRSMEAELRHLLADALREPPGRREVNLAEAIRRRFLPLGGADDLELHPPVEAVPPAIEQ
jgi:plasmid stability protein